MKKYFHLGLQFFAQKKGGGTASTNRSHDSKSKRLGVKIFGSQKVKAGNIIIRQRGTKYNCKENTYLGKDHTIHAKIDGYVFFSKKKKKTYVSVFSSLD